MDTVFLTKRLLTHCTNIYETIAEADHISYTATFTRAEFLVHLLADDDYADNADNAADDDYAGDQSLKKMIQVAGPTTTAPSTRSNWF